MPLGRVAGLCGHPRSRGPAAATGKWPLAGGGKPPQIADLSRCGMTGQRHGCTFAASCARLGSYPNSAHRREAARAGRALEVDCKVAHVSGFVGPCQPSRVARPPSGPFWVHEIKHDGYRLMVHRDGSRIRCFTRNGHDWGDRFPGIDVIQPCLAMRRLVNRRVSGGETRTGVTGRRPAVFFFTSIGGALR